MENSKKPKITTAAKAATCTFLFLYSSFPFSVGCGINASSNTSSSGYSLTANLPFLFLLFLFLESSAYDPIVTPSVDVSKESPTPPLTLVYSPLCFWCFLAFFLCYFSASCWGNSFVYSLSLAWLWVTLFYKYCFCSIRCLLLALISLIWFFFSLMTCSSAFFKYSILFFNNSFSSNSFLFFFSSTYTGLACSDNLLYSYCSLFN